MPLYAVLAHIQTRVATHQARTHDVHAVRARSGRIITVTKEIRRCLWCAASIPEPSGPGRPRVFCRRSHRQRHYEARRLANAQGLAPDEVLISRRQFDDWRDRIYLLEAGLEDAALDLGDAPALREYTEAFQTLYEAASRAKEFRLEARALGAE